MFGNTKTNQSGFDKRVAKYICVIDFRIDGIPCLIGVTEYFGQPPHKGSVYTCWSDVDYYGYEEISYDVLDRKGYEAKWLLKKVDNKINQKIEELISRKMKND